VKQLNAKLLNAKLPPQMEAAKKLEALVFDWAGTTVDFGSLAPARTLQRLFAGAGIPLTDSEVRRDMGLAKREHVRNILSMERVQQCWRAHHGRQPTPEDVDELYELFVPLQFSCLAEYSAMIPGVVDGVKRFRERGLKIGSTTGYTRAMLDVLVDSSAKAGYKPDCSVSPEDVGSGRPEPFMMYETAKRLRVSPLASIAKIGDTPADIAEGLNAGAWSIGVAGTGNGIAMSRPEFHALSAREREDRLCRARRELQKAGAHYVIDTLAELDAVLDEIEDHLKESG